MSSLPPRDENTIEKVARVHLPDPKEGQKVVLSNKLVDANYRLTLTQLRLVWVFGSLIRSQDEDFRFYQVKAREVIHYLGIETSGDAYRQLENAVDGLVGSVVRIPRGGQKKGENDGWTKFSWVASAEYKKGEGIIEFEFSDKLKPYLLKLTRDFTVAEMQDLMSLRSVYLGKLYIFLKRVLKLGVYTVELPTLRITTGVDLVNSKGEIIDSVYKRFVDYKRFILDAGVKAFASKTSLRYQYTPKKTGRKVTHIEFRISFQGRPTEQFFPAQPSVDGLPVASEILSFDSGFNVQVAEKIAEQGWETVKWNGKKIQDKEKLLSMRDEGFSFSQYVREKIQLAKMSDGGVGFLHDAIRYNWTSTEQKQVQKQKAARDKEKEKSTKEQAARRTGEQSRIQEQKKSAEYDRRFSEMPLFAQQEIRRRATEMFRNNASDFERGRYEREKADGKTIDEMSVLVAATYRKYRNQLMDSPEFAEQANEVNA